MQLAPFRWSARERVLRRVESLPGGTAELAISVVRGRLRVGGAPESDELARRVQRMFQLHVDLSGFHELARGSRTHRWVAESGFGRLLCAPTLWEDAVRIIATTNTTWRQTVRMIELLVATCGRDGAFPEPRDVLRISEQELQERCRLGYRAKSVHALAAAVVSGELDLERIGDPSQSTAELYRACLRLPGIGPYGAAHLLAMDGRHDFIAVDSEFRRFVRERYHRGRKVADRTLLRHYDRWGRWKYLGYWSELWASVAGPLQSTECGGTRSAEY